MQLTYNEEIDGRAGEAGQLRIPEEFFIALKPFLGGDTFCVPARFRYRIQEGRLVMWYELVRADIKRIEAHREGEHRHRLEAPRRESQHG